jgi:hypothetical protein
MCFEVDLMVEILKTEDAFLEFDDVIASRVHFLREEGTNEGILQLPIYTQLFG